MSTHEITAKDLSWAKVTFSDTSEAQAALKELEGDIRALKRALEEKWFEDTFTENEMRSELKKMEALEDELCDLVFQDLFDLI